VAGNDHPRTAEPHRQTVRGGRRVAEVGITVALSVVLGFWSFSPVPQGGQVSLDLVPVLLLARLRGPGPGILAGVTYGILHALQEPILVHPVQGLLDYPVAFGMLGLAGWLPPGPRWDVPGVLLGVSGRMAAHVLSGVLFLHLFVPVERLPGSPLTYALAYNATYLVPAGLLAALLVPLLARASRR